MADLVTGLLICRILRHSQKPSLFVASDAESTAKVVAFSFGNVNPVQTLLGFNSRQGDIDDLSK